MADERASPRELARKCELFMHGAKKLYDEQGERADMWLFELYHHLNDCQAALAAAERAGEGEFEDRLNSFVSDLVTDAFMADIHNMDGRGPREVDELTRQFKKKLLDFMVDEKIRSDPEGTIQKLNSIDPALSAAERVAEPQPFNAVKELREFRKKHPAAEQVAGEDRLERVLETLIKPSWLGPETDGNMIANEAKRMAAAIRAAHAHPHPLIGRNASERK